MDVRGRDVLEDRRRRARAVVGLQGADLELDGIAHLHGGPQRGHEQQVVRALARQALGPADERERLADGDHAQVPAAERGDGVPERLARALLHEDVVVRAGGDPVGARLQRDDGAGRAADERDERGGGEQEGRARAHAPLVGLAGSLAQGRGRMSGTIRRVGTARDPHGGPVPESAWAADAQARERGRVEVFNATRPGGLDGWTMDLRQYEAVRAVVLEAIDAHAGPDGTVALKDVVAVAQARLGDDPLFPGGRLTNYVRYTKVDLEARCEVERVPGSSPQRIRRLR